MSLHKKYQRPSCVFHKTLHFKDPPVFFSQNTSFHIKHLNPSNYKTCLYNLLVCLYTKNTKDPPVFFTKHYISKILLCFFTKHYISYQKHLNPSNYKTCLYNLFMCLYTKNTKDPPVSLHKTLHFISKNPHVFSQKHLNLSNYKTCLYNLFPCLYTKIPKILMCFSQNTFFTNILS